jgi:hypothetical protein
MRTGLGVPAVILVFLRLLPGTWGKLTAMAHTLPHEYAVMGTPWPAGISVALVAMVAALTFTAAMLGTVGRWIRPSRRSLRQATEAAARRDDEDAERGFFARLARFTQRWPVLVTLGVTAALLAAGAPLLGLPSSCPCSKACRAASSRSRSPPTCPLGTAARRSRR